MKDWQSKAVLVTGAASGIGRAVSLAFARRGAAVAVADINGEGLAQITAQIEALGATVWSSVTDITQEEAVAAMVTGAVAALGDLHAMVNNAGAGTLQVPLTGYEQRDWQRVLDINLTGVWLCMKHEIPHLLARGSGAIVNVSSVAGLKGFPKNAAYAAAKHGVLGLSKTAALEYARAGLRINAICPGFTDTPMVDQLSKTNPELGSRLTRHIPMGRLADPGEIASAIVFLCGPEAAYINGHALVADGGLSVL